MLNKKNSQTIWSLFVGVVVIALLLSGCGAAQETKVYRVGILSGLGPYFAPAVDGFKAQMAELGYVEGENIIYDVQETTVDIEAYKSITQKFVADNVDLIFVFPTEASMEAKAATQGTDIPVVFALAFTDVAGINLIDSIREPGGNITGVRFPSAEIASKRMEVLVEMAPDAKRLLVAYLKGYPNVPGQLDVVRSQANDLGMELIELPVSSPSELQAELDRRAALDDIGIDAVLMIAEPVSATPAFYAAAGPFSYEHGLPIGGALMMIEGEYGSLFGLGPDAYHAGEEAAILADKIFTGTTAGTIPVVTSESILRINYTAAQELGVTVPDGLLKQADEIIR
jgi:putative tryptophan/tyrosine transport system substrate-binding protein